VWGHRGGEKGTVAVSDDGAAVGAIGGAGGGGVSDREVRKVKSEGQTTRKK
jgi:hypothetical protein